VATQGLSLVGFVADQAAAIAHLRNSCVPNPVDKTDAQLVADWDLAKHHLGAPIPNAGNPQMTPIPNSHPNIARLLTLPWAPYFLNLIGLGASFQMVEIDPLLAFQFTVDTERSNGHCGNFGNPPTEQELFDCCLPVELSKDEIHVSQQGQNLVLKSRSLNLTVVAEGPIPNVANTIGLQFNWTLPFVHVVRFNGRCYLHNGYHRAYGVRAAGAMMMPCMFRDVQTADAVGIRADGQTFSEGLLASQNPPTLAHFKVDRALPVMLKRTTRILHVSWSQHTMYDE